METSSIQLVGISTFCPTGVFLGLGVLAHFESEIYKSFYISGLYVRYCFKYCLIYIFRQNAVKKLHKKHFELYQAFVC